MDVVKFMCEKCGKSFTKDGLTKHKNKRTRVLLNPPWLKTPCLKRVVENAVVGAEKETHAPADGATGNIKVY
jgi:hypothetical protein